MDEIRVESTFDEPSAHAAAGLLRANGIQARVIREDAALAVIGPTGTGGFHVLVAAAHERAARELLGTERPGR
jgi:transglutaminase-like putative cysteine protease